ncbi:2OG-Fe(II) oxygenase family protein [Peristeroidobacter soli]|uniref:2OG-Fe(II) oxygenase family protein n=1 Tax=Peristeroidobacter soli TaxID=2497877 RepID=UPI00101CF99A|nr:tetratricopeptide repeat protein [Peristeroidobacter soli]
MSVSGTSNAAITHGLRQAQTLLQQGLHAQAADVCSRLLAQWPTLTEALQLLALARKAVGDVSEAERLLRACVQLQPQRADFHANLANLLRASGRVADAEASYRLALQADARFKPARLGLIRTLNAAGVHPQAQIEAAALVHDDPADAEGWAELAAALKGQGRFSDAEAAYRAALARRPSFAIARHNLGSLLSQLERADEALREIDRAVEAGLKGHAVHLNRAIALQQLGRFEAAEQEFEHAAQLAPAHVDTQARLAKLRFMRGDADFTRGLRAVVAGNLRNSQLHLCQASLLRDAGRLSEATAAFQDAIAHCGEQPELLMGLALTAMDAGIPGQALAPAQAAVCARPDYLHGSTCLQSVLLSLGRADEAMPLIQRARALAPFHQEHIACEATAARMLGLPRYQELYDYDRFVVPRMLDRPDGFASIEAFCDELMGVLAERQQLAMHPLDQSLRFGAQTPRSLLADPHPLIREFLELLSAPIAEYRSRLPQSEDHPLLSRNNGEARLSGCWSIRLHRGGYHLNHVHPSGWLSSACYIHAPADARDTVARSGWIKFGEPRYPTPGVDAERMLQPRAGMLVLFPSYMWHGTMPITTDEPRVTIGADVLPGTA